jgi:hypothetical protein
VALARFNQFCGRIPEGMAGAKHARLAATELDVLQLAWTKATPQEKRSLALALFEAIYGDLEVMDIASFVLRPAFRLWIDANVK